MSGRTKIEWTDMQWNPVAGCSKVSPGCANCYAEALTKRYAGAKGWPAEFLPWTPENAAANVVLHPDRLDAPLRWRQPRRVFVNSMSDLFHEAVPDEFIDRVFAVMALTPQHTYQVLTKRPERMLAYMQILRMDDRDYAAERIHDAMRSFDLWPDTSEQGFATTGEWPLPNVWLGVSAENQHWADERIPLLLQTPAAVRFVSVEPMLGPVTLTRGLIQPLCILADDGPGEATYGAVLSAMRQVARNQNIALIDWVICGGESGAKRRPFDLAWARDLRDQCRAAAVPFFMKQGSALKPGQPCGDPDLDGCKEFPG